MKLYIIIFVIGAFLMAALSNVSVFYYIFRHRRYLIWKDVYKHPYNCFPIYKSKIGVTYKYKNYTVLLDENSKMASIHKYGKCVFSKYDTYRSKKLYKAITDIQLIKH